MDNNEYPLNQEQKEASEAFFTYLFDPTAKEFILSGPAGVGKTYWMGYIIDKIMPRYYETCQLIGEKPEYDSVTMTATTNKAAEVLEYATGRTTQTIHSFLNVNVYEDWDTGRQKLQKNERTWHVHENKIVFVDEASMIDGPIHKYIHEGTHNSKIVYVGDQHQLAPVMEKFSPIYQQGTQVFELTQQMRTFVPELQALNQQLRDTVITGVFNPIQEVPGIIDYLDDNAMQKQMEITFANQTKESRILGYTNRRIIEYNDYIRQMRQLPDIYGEGEILINNAGIKLGKGNVLSAESEVTIIANRGRETIEIEKGVNLNVQRLDFMSHIGNRYYSIPVPMDRAHFTSLVKYYAKNKKFERMYYLKNNFPDLRQRDAATVHKSQGSTYDSVFVDLGNISTCHQADQAARMLYVAFSRARTRVFVYGDLASKYGGFIRA